MSAHIRGVQPDSSYEASNLASEIMRFNDIHASGNSRQHNGHQYHNTTNNYATSAPYGSVQVQPPEHSVHSDFIRACRQGQGKERLGLLLGKGANIDHRDEDQWTPLHHAAASGSFPTLEYLVEIGADPYASGHRIGTPLHCAASSGSVECVKHLLAAGVHAQVSDEWVGTPLHHASFVGSVDLVRCLLEHGADIHAFGEWVGTPLSIAAARSHLAVIEVLLEYKADVNQKCAYFGSAAHMACAAGNVDILRTLHREGAGFDRRVPTCYAVYANILDPVRRSLSSSLACRLVHGEPAMQSTALILAVQHGSLEAARFCLELSPDESHLPTWIYELTWHTDEEWRDPTLDWAPWTKLAIENIDVDMLLLFLDKGIDPAWQVMEEHPMLYLGASEIRKIALDGTDASACISLLLQHGAHNSCIDTGGSRDTLLMEVMRREHDHLSYEVAKAVLKHGAPVNASNSQGQTAVMVAAGTDHKSRVHCVELLCEHGADVNLEDENGRTALRYAEKWGGSEDFVEVKRILQHASEKELGRCLPSSPIKEQPLLSASPVKKQPLLQWLSAWLSAWYG
jgi:ankyrin repeat protein